MSTKASIRWGDGYHLYNDYMDEWSGLDVVNLELTGVQFVANNDGVCVAIPRPVARALGLLPPEPTPPLEESK